MPRYRVLQKSFIGNRIVEDGEVVEYDGEPSGNLELIEQPKQAKGKKAEAAAADQGAEGEGLV